MKKIILTILIAGPLFSCKKSFLELTPVDSKTTAVFYKTPDDAFQALVAAYNILNLDGYGNIWLTSEIASDDCAGGGGTADNGPRQWDRNINYNNLNSNAWSKYYKGIYRVNVFLQNVDGCNFGNNTTLKDRYIGEAHFLRAYYYFDLVRMFGNVVLLDKPIEGTDYKIPQSSADSVYSLIVSDLKIATSNLSASAVKFDVIPATEYGRATKWAAESLLARVFLYYSGYYNKPDVLGQFSKTDAITALNDVIQNSGYGLVSDYASLWRASSVSRNKVFAGQNNREGVFVIQFTNQGLGNWSQNNGNRTQVMIGLRGSASGIYNTGWGMGPISNSLVNSYDVADSNRKKATIISIEDEGLSYTKASDQFQYTGYFWKKYTPLTGASAPENNGGDFQIDQFDNYPVIRYADVLLMAAELNLSTNLGTAQNYYNAVRDRAFGDASHRKTLTGDVAGFNLIMNERRFEFALEGLRYWDLLRQGVSVAKAAIDVPGSDEFAVNFRVITNGLFAIPETQIGLSNGTLVQNPGWTN